MGNKYNKSQRVNAFIWSLILKKIFIFFLFVLLLSSCQSFNNLSFSENEELPYWVSNPRVRSGRIAYINEGSGASEEEARLNALENSLLEMGDDLGLDAYALYFRELGTSGEIRELDGRITNTYTRSYASGRYSCYVMIDISADLFDSMQSPETRREEEVEQSITELLEEARNYYMQNRDVDALNSTLNALLLSLENNIETQGHSANEILELSTYYLEPLEIRYKQEKGSIDGEITLRRKRGLLYPLVYYADLKGTYAIRNNDKRISYETIEFNTAESGRYYFHNTNNYILQNGDLTISLGFDRSVLDRISEIAEPGLLDEFEALLESKTASFSYMETRGALRDVDILISEYDIHGAIMESVNALEAFNAELEDSGYLIRAEEGIGDDDDEILASYKANGGSKPTLIIIRVGVADVVEKGDEEFLVYVESTVNGYDTATGGQLFSNDYQEATAGASTYDEAVAEACTLCGSILASASMIFF